MVTLDVPTALSQRVINALKAEPKTVDLRAQAPHFYKLGARILELFEEEDMVDVLIDVCFCHTHDDFEEACVLMMLWLRHSRSVRRRFLIMLTTLGVL